MRCSFALVALFFAGLGPAAAKPERLSMTNGPSITRRHVGSYSWCGMQIQYDKAKPIVSLGFTLSWNPSTKTYDLSPTGELIGARSVPPLTAHNFSPVYHQFTSSVLLLSAIDYNLQLNVQLDGSGNIAAFKLLDFWHKYTKLNVPASQLELMLRVRLRTPCLALQTHRVTQRRLARAASTAAQPNRSTEHKDVVIIGGGAVGLALAASLSTSLACQGCQGLLVEAGDLSRSANWQAPTGSYSNRVSSLTNESLAFLQRTGIWGHVDQTRIRNVYDMQITDGITAAHLAFDSTDLSTSETPRPMARMVENVNMQRAMLRVLAAPAGGASIATMDQTKVISIDRNEETGWPSVTLSDGRAITARLLIGADGFNSPVRSYAGIESFGWSYNRNGVVGTLQLAETGGNSAFQRFLPTGPIAWLPMSDSSASLVWSTMPDIAQALKLLDGPTLGKLVNAAFRLPWLSVDYLHKTLRGLVPELQSTDDAARLRANATLCEEIEWRSSPDVLGPELAFNMNTSGPYDLAQSIYPPKVSSLELGSVASFPLRMSHAKFYLGEPNLGMPSRTVLIGDAAHTVHPLAGQGLNLGLADAQSLLGVVENNLDNGADIGSFTALQAYPRERYLANHTMLSAIDKLHKLYAIESGPLVWARSTGIEVLNELPMVKAALMGQAGASKSGSFKPADIAARAIEAGTGGLGILRSFIQGRLVRP
ncbi:uncharacterized protein L969DRAFT_625299 [Mixia osmundae IAM 14324]|uniref:Ubiquinone biosynthesis monooxygenase COQ6, mitochondrial n=1 Tax=Mixia osmundae (strain CBS 9802 / IAM 14324 / JCM 22182 / KY 12970) TaxID=764103 RepID=G7E6Y6_MIXOS|nr:uncharacterized protein L969DRAFT_625299 [Mixia osmundae IAM 14324]KEI39021.1 hypothetical protein L969DRAFT_625299 [Mixia osmundae IAM 14324]GAA98596.1 hypothetical protein E5Q_05283 [Mixia osmundae IAM 14324]